MVPDKFELAWQLFVELRKEIIETQKVRTRVVGFKITLVSAGIGLIAANIYNIPSQLLVIPAMAAILFDLLINSYSISIKRLGFFCRTIIEPILKECTNWPSMLWEEYMSQPEVGQNLSLIGNIGLTSLVTTAAIITLFYPFDLVVSPPLILFLILFMIYDFVTHLRPRWISRHGFKKH